ncbi:MAG: hypothetical protein Fues2KO_00900 [Fuerstiella sp.]
MRPLTWHPAVRSEFDAGLAKLEAARDLATLRHPRRLQQLDIAYSTARRLWFSLLSTLAACEPVEMDQEYYALWLVRDDYEHLPDKVKALLTVDAQPVEFFGSVGGNIGHALNRCAGEILVLARLNSLHRNRRPSEDVCALHPWFDVGQLMAFRRAVIDRYDFIQMVDEGVLIKPDDQAVVDAIAQFGGRMTSTELKKLKSVYRRNKKTGKHCLDRLAELGLIELPTSHGSGIRLTALGWACTKVIPKRT